MSEKINIADLKANTDIVEVIGRYVRLKPDGIHFVAPCPFHDEKTSSFKVTPSKKMFKCFGCGKGGDVIDFLEAMGKSKADAIKELADPFNTAAIPHGGIVKEKSLKVEKESPWKQVVPAVKSEGMYRHPKHGEPAATWDYHNANGVLAGCICRFNLPDGSKEVLPLTYVTDGKRIKWSYRGFEKPRPLYDLHILEKHPTKAVLVVEGEKTAEAAKKLFPLTNVVTWMGGAQGVKHADWKVLIGRKVILWPDNDEPGFTAMHDVHDQLKDIADVVKWVVNPPDAEKGWDLADVDWTPEKARSYSASNIIEYPGREFKYETRNAQNSITWDLNVLERPEKENGKKKKETPVIKMPPADPPKKKWTAYELKGTEYFKMLGTKKEGNGMMYFFYAYSTKTVIGLSPAGMTKNNLMQLAPLDWWAKEFPSAKFGFATDEAADYLINKNSEFGTFSDKRLRGRGAWMDGKNIVIHAGDKLYVNNKEVAFADFKSKFIYETGEELDFSTDNPITTKDSRKLVDLVKLLSWERPINAYYFLGWCVVAPIGGILSWRPHIWLTGAKGTGKTKILKDVARPLLGETALALEGETTEPAVRQLLNNDALPVVFDEAEGFDRKAQDRIQSVLSLIRSSSANDGSVLGKGGSGGSAIRYIVRSCFLLASISDQIVQESDKSRVTALGLANPDSELGRSNYQKFLKQYSEFFTDDFCRGIRARTILLLPTLLTNIKVFTAAAASEIGTQRAGDQMGVMLAGAYSLHSDKVITYEEAVAWVKRADDWTEEKYIKSSTDELSLLAFLLEQMIRIGTQSATVDRCVGELVLMAMGLMTAEWNITPEQANDRLKRSGLKVEGEFLIISNSHSDIVKMLAGTPWAKNHNKILMRLKGAVADNSQRFAAGVSTRAVKLPKDTVFKNYVPDTFRDPEMVKAAAAGLSAPAKDVFTQTEEDFPF